MLISTNRCSKFKHDNCVEQASASFVKGSEVWYLGKRFGSHLWQTLTRPPNQQKECFLMSNC